jgi:hypothetical protein
MIASSQNIECEISQQAKLTMSGAAFQHQFKDLAELDFGPREKLLF